MHGSRGGKFTVKLLKIDLGPPPSIWQTQLFLWLEPPPPQSIGKFFGSAHDVPDRYVFKVVLNTSTLLHTSYQNKQ